MPSSALAPLLTHAKTLVQGAIDKAATESIEGDVQQLKSVAFAITSAGRHGTDLPHDERQAVWDLVSQIWDACIDSANSPSGVVNKNAFLQMRHTATDLIGLAKDEGASDEERLCKCQFFHKTGKLWSGLKDYETAEGCYAKAMEYAQFLLDVSNNLAKSQLQREECAVELFGLYLDRTVAAWQLQQKALASNLLARAKDLANNEDLSSDVGFQLNLTLANVSIKHAEHLLAATEADAAVDIGEAIGLLNAANEVIANLSAEDDDPATESKEAAANQMQAQVYSLLAWAYLEAGDKPGPAMNCMHSLRKLPAELRNQPVISFLAMKALCQLNKLEEAETELLSVVSSTDVSLSMCLGSIKVMLAAAEGQMQTSAAEGSVTGLAGVKSAVGLILERFAAQPEAPVQLVRLMLAQERVTEEAEQTSLEICAAEKTMEMLTQEGASALQQQLFNLLYSYAADHFQQRKFDAANRFFSAAYMYAEQDNKAKTARIMAVCNIGMKALDRALEYVDIAAQTEPTTVFNSFLRLKVYLLQKDCASAVSQIQAMMKCEDFSHEILRVAAQEAMGAEQALVAKKALMQLYDMVEADSDGCFQPGDQAVILSNVIKITQDSALQAKHGAHSYLEELSAIYDRGSDKLDSIGYSRFFGADLTDRATASDWLAANAWNAAIKAGEAKMYQITAVLLGAAGRFYAAHPNPETTVQYQTMAFLMAASASLEGVSKMSSDKDSTEYLAMANKMLPKYQAAAQALTARQQSLGEPPGIAEDKCQQYMLIMEFELAVHAKDVARQHAVLQQCRETPSFSVENVLKLANFSKAAPNSNQDVTREALQMTLQLLLSKGHAVRHDQVAQTLRTLLEMSPTDEDKIKLYQQAQQLLAGLPGSAYPDRELQWLVSTCWNRGAHQAKFLRCEAAEQYMRLALELLEHCPSLSGRKQMMMEELNKVVQRKAGQNKAAAPATSSPVDRKRKRTEQTDITTDVSLAALTNPPDSA